MKEIEELEKKFPYYFDKDKKNLETTLKINSTSEIIKFIEFIYKNWFQKGYDEWFNAKSDIISDK